MSENEQMMPLVEAIHRATGQSVHRVTADRWANRGLRGVKLQSWRLGGKRLTTQAAVLRFVRASTYALEEDAK